MQLGMVGLGRMGANMVRRLMKGGHTCTVFDMSPKSVEELAKEGADRLVFDQGFCEQVAEAARDMADDSGGGR